MPQPAGAADAGGDLGAGGWIGRGEVEEGGVCRWDVVGGSVFEGEEAAGAGGGERLGECEGAEGGEGQRAVGIDGVWGLFKGERGRKGKGERVVV